jgi:CIC family chloride channel protein
LALFAGDRLQTFMLPAQVVTGLPPEAVALGAIVALTGACAGLAFLKILAAAQPLLIRTPLPPVARAALVGGIVGIAGLFLPRVLGTGIHEVQLLFGGSAQEIGALLALLLARTLLTPLCLKNGFIGGIIGPSLAIGAAIGYVCAQAGGYLLPGVTVAPALFAMLGAAAVLSAVSHAPVFAAIFIFETTGDARLIAPLLLVSAIAFYVSRHFQATSAYTEAFTAWGLRVQPGRNRIVDLPHAASDPTH